MCVEEVLETSDPPRCSQLVSSDWEHLPRPPTGKAGETTDGRTDRSLDVPENTESVLLGFKAAAPSSFRSWGSRDEPRSPPQPTEGNAREEGAPIQDGGPMPTSSQRPIASPVDGSGEATAPAGTPRMSIQTEARRGSVIGQGNNRCEVVFRSEAATCRSPVKRQFGQTAVSLKSYTGPFSRTVFYLKKWSRCIQRA